MDNHVPLLLTGSSEVSLPKAIQSVGRKYVSYFNSRHGRTGTLWEGRYKSSLVADESYLFNCHRYIEQNPVRAGIVPHASQYLWSSTCHFLGVRRDSLITAHESWLAIADDHCLRSTVWGGMVGAPLGEAVVKEIREASRTGLALGDEAGCRALEIRAGRSVTPGERGWRKGRPRGQ
jgi:putative transposase